MAFNNTVTIIGNLTRDPELRFTQGGIALCEFGLAWNLRKQNGEDEAANRGLLGEVPPAEAS